MKLPNGVFVRITILGREQSWQNTPGIFSPNGEKAHIVGERGKNNLNAKTGKKIPKKNLLNFFQEIWVFGYLCIFRILISDQFSIGNHYLVIGLSKCDQINRFNYLSTN